MQLRPSRRQPHHVVLHNDWGPHSQKASPARPASSSGAVVVAAGAIPPSFPLSAPSIFTTAGAGFVLPSMSLCPSIVIGAHNDVTSVQHGVQRLTFVVPMRRFFVQFSKGSSSPPPPLWWGGEERGEILLLIMSAFSNDAKEPLDKKQSEIFDLDKRH